ncbi:MAG: glutathione S-transferase family protein [Nannocystales bacterium]
MKLYSDVRSGSCRRVLTVIEHLGIDLEIVDVDILAGATKAPDFLALNPNGLLPVLQDGDTILWEAAAIMLYLCESVGDTTLVPVGPARFDMFRWMFWAAEHFRIPAPIYFEENVVAPIMGGQPDATRIAEADRRIEHDAPILDTHLATRRFVLGDRPTLADIDLAAPLSQMPRSRVPYQKFPNIMRWYEELGVALPAWGTTGKQLHDSMEQALAG